MSGSENPGSFTFKWPLACKSVLCRPLALDKEHGMSNRSKHKGATALTAR